MPATAGRRGSREGVVASMRQPDCGGGGWMVSQCMRLTGSRGPGLAMMRFRSLICIPAAFSEAAASGASLVGSARTTSVIKLSEDAASAFWAPSRNVCPVAQFSEESLANHQGRR